MQQIQHKWDFFFFSFGEGVCVALASLNKVTLVWGTGAFLVMRRLISLPDKRQSCCYSVQSRLSAYVSVR